MICTRAIDRGQEHNLFNSRQGLPPGALPNLTIRWSVLIAYQMEVVSQSSLSLMHLSAGLTVTVHHMKTRGQRRISLTPVSRQACVRGSSERMVYIAHAQRSLSISRPCNVLTVSVFWVLSFYDIKVPYRQKLHLIYHFSHGSKTLKKQFRLNVTVFKKGPISAK